MYALARAAFVAAITALASCTQAEFLSINRQFNPTDGDARLIDAKQRAIIAVKRPILNEEGNPIFSGKWKDKAITTPVVCAEPSPDALQATAAALSLNGSISQPNLEAAIAGAYNNSEAVSSIGLRT